MSLFSSNANIQPNEWNHIAFTYNKETSNVNLFVNNKIVNSTKLEIELSKSLFDFNIGYSSNINDGEAYFNGTIDEILLYNRELNPKELEYVSKSNNTDLFLKNLVGGRWSFDEFTTQVNNLLDNSGNNNTAVVSGNVIRGSTPVFGNHSIAFDGSSKISAPNASLHTGYMSVGAWIKPTAYGETFIKKEGVFDVGIRNDGYPKMTIGDVSSETNIQIQKSMLNLSQVVESPLAHFALENNTKDSTGLNSDAVGHNITYNTDSYNTYIGNTSVQLNGTDSYIDCGKVFQNVSDPNKMTLSMWVNMSELDTDKKYPLMSASNGFEWYLTKPSSGIVDTYQNFEINVPIDFGVFATTWRITWTQETNAGYMRTGEVGIYDEYYEPTFQHSPLPYTSINPSNWNVIYDGNSGQHDLQNNNGPYSYTITFQNAIQLKQLKLGSTDGGAGNSLSGHPSKSVKFEYQLENGSFVEHSTLIMKDITSGENGTETFNTNNGSYPWKVTDTIYPLIGMYGMDMFRWNGSKWYHHQSYGDDMVINYPKTIGSTTYY